MYVVVVEKSRSLIKRKDKVPGKDWGSVCGGEDKSIVHQSLRVSWVNNDGAICAAHLAEADMLCIR